MGDPKRQRRKFETPRHPWREGILAEELKLLGIYGLRNKRELWKHKTDLSKYRNIARSLLALPIEKRSKAEKELLTKLQHLGVIGKNASIDDVLDLTVENILDRRLQTYIYKTGLAASPHQARQLITHGHICVGERKITSPSYLVPYNEENQIKYSPDSPIANPEHPIRKSAAHTASTPEPPQSE
jgi:small subunit ribosomal protein S4